ncbi:cysteine/serine-rich nuclear protein 3-like [Ornithodoros turicata]|uniref:cysteine/serine-rich nuclear protein 3-like n=1 Tax=Ornithodoros turicata TaxID=34597 RepID=UPI0031398879
MPKRALDETGGLPDVADGTSLPSSSGEHTPSSQGEDCQDGRSPPHKCRRKAVGFNDVTVYYFQRMQGFTCVPSQGGSTLGMSPVHTEKKTFSLKQHSEERRRLHFEGIEQSSSSSSPTDETLTSFEDCANSSSNGKFDDDDDLDEADEEDVDTLNYLQPVPTRQRRALLRASGVRKIDALEKDECRDIRTSREFCGCACRGRCLPHECSCSLAGISCQVDRMSFPCGCTREGCANESGRTEFNPVRVRAHFLHTLMRLELEKQQRQLEGCDPSSATQLSLASNLNFHRLNPRTLMYYNGSSVDTATMRYSSEEEEEEEEEDETSYSENSDYSTEDETEEARSYDGVSDDKQSDSGDLTCARLASDALDYTDLSEAVPKDSAAAEERREATRGVVPVDPVFVGCGDDCATTGLEQATDVEQNGRVDDGEGSSSAATTDSAFGEIIKASLGEVTTL